MPADAISPDTANAAAGRQPIHDIPFSRMDEAQAREAIAESLDGAGFARDPLRVLVESCAMNAWRNSPQILDGHYGMMNPTRLEMLHNGWHGGGGFGENLGNWQSNAWYNDAGQLESPVRDRSERHQLEMQRAADTAARENLSPLLEGRPGGAASKSGPFLWEDLLAGGRGQGPGETPGSDHPLYLQANQMMGQQQPEWSVQRQAAAAGHIALKAHESGLTRIDSLATSQDGRWYIASQIDPDNPDKSRHITIDRSLANTITMAESLENLREATGPAKPSSPEPVSGPDHEVHQGPEHAQEAGAQMARG